MKTLLWIITAGMAVLGDQSRHLKRAIAFGTSQSGRFLRTFMYDGFNADENGKAVFDGVWSHVAGAGRGSFNFRFAQPSRDGHPHLNCLYPRDIFPSRDDTQHDSEMGAGAIVGLGYDFRMGKSFSLSPYLNGIAGNFDGGSANFWQVGLGLSWH